MVEVYRRMLFTAVLPILAPQGLQRAALGCVLAVLAVIEVFSMKALLPLDLAMKHSSQIIDILQFLFVSAWKSFSHKKEAI